MSKSYIELRFDVPEAEAELRTLSLVEAGAEGVEERDATTLEKPAAGMVALVVWIAPDRVEDFLARAGSPSVDRRERNEDEWRDAWKKHFTTRKVGRFLIVPSWEQPPAKLDAGVCVLRLDPGRAFGTGGHASTRLCLDLLGDLPLVERFLDVGCGSGVLAIGCARAFPQATGIGVDIDPDSPEVSRENAAINEVADRIAFSSTSLVEVHGPFDLVLANIQPDVLIALAAQLAGRVNQRGALILSGILIEALPPVIDAFRARGFSLRARKEEDGWVGVHLERAS